MPQARPNYSAKPSYEEWCQMALWTLDEAIALSLGLDPDLVPSLDVVQSNAFPSKLKTDYEKRRRVVMRANDDGLLSRGGHTGMAKVMPHQFLSWAKSNALRTPSGLEDAVSARGGVISNWTAEIRSLQALIESMTSAHKSEIDAINRALNALRASTVVAEGKPLTKAERKAAQKIIIAMATAKYDYDPGRNRNAAAGQIVGHAAEHGLTIDENTVRSWLEKSAKLMSRKSGPEPKLNSV